MLKPDLTILFKTCAQIVYNFFKQNLALKISDKQILVNKSHSITHKKTSHKISIRNNFGLQKGIIEKIKNP